MKMGPPLPVDRLIEQLGDSDFHKRELATRLLRHLGPDALPQLRLVPEHADPEVRRRLDDLIGQLQTLAFLAPKRVTLDLRKKTVKQVCEEISRQTGYKIEAWPSNEQQPYSFHFEQVPFWQALDQVCHATGLVPQQGYGDSIERLQAQDSYVPYICYDGAFRLTADSLHQNRSIEFAVLLKNPTAIRRTEGLTFQFTLFTEPRLPLLGVGEPHLESAYDSEQNSMVPPSGPANLFGRNHVSARYGNGYRSFSQQVGLALNRPSEKASTVKLVKGTLPVTLLAAEKPEVVTDKLQSAKGQKFKVNGASFAIEDVTEMLAAQCQVKLPITDESKDASDNDYTWVNSLYNRIEVQDYQGKKFQMTGANYQSTSPRHVQMTLTCGAPAGNAKMGQATKLIYHSWTTMQATVAFSFKDLPLP